jgi:hypothetical protein
MKQVTVILFFVFLQVVLFYNPLSAQMDSIDGRTVKVVTRYVCGYNGKDSTGLMKLYRYQYDSSSLLLRKEIFYETWGDDDFYGYRRSIPLLKFRVTNDFENGRPASWWWQHRYDLNSSDTVETFKKYSQIIRNYDSMGREVQTEVTEKGKLILEEKYIYDSKGRQVKTYELFNYKNGKNEYEIKRMQFDKQGRITSFFMPTSSLADGDSEIYVYNNNGCKNVLLIDDRWKMVFSFDKRDSFLLFNQYNEYGYPRRWCLTEREIYKRDTAGHLLRYEDHSSVIDTFPYRPIVLNEYKNYTYDSAFNCIAIDGWDKYSKKYRTEFKYDKSGKCVKASYYSEGELSVNEFFTYNSEGDLTGLFAYAADGNLIQREVYVIEKIH